MSVCNPVRSARDRLIEAEVHAGDDQAKCEHSLPLLPGQRRPQRASDAQQNQRAKPDPKKDGAGRAERVEQMTRHRGADLDGGDRPERE